MELVKKEKILVPIRFSGWATSIVPILRENGKI